MVIKSERSHKATIQFSKPSHEATTQFSKPENSLTLIIVLTAFGIFVIILGGFWLYCKIYSQEDPQEEAGPDPASVELAGAGLGPALGLDPHSINLFPLVPFPVSVPIGFGGSECQICLEDFVKGEDVRVLPTCRHIFHDKCIRSWLTSHTQCAICRYQYSGWEPGVLPPDAP